MEISTMELATQRLGIAQQAIDNHAQTLQTEFSSFEDFQDLFVDVFGNNSHSSDTLADLQSQFANGTLRPQVKFVSADTLTDAAGNQRGAAFDNASQTILLADNLDEAGIASSIEQELGHWWDVQLNGTVDTTTAEGKAFDEGTAYAERFSEGTDGDNIFSNLVYQNDLHTVMIDGQEIGLEYRPIATWNIQGATRFGRNVYEDVFAVMNNPGQGQGQIEVIALQEAGNVGESLRNLVGRDQVQATPNVIGDRVNQFDFQYLGENWRVYELVNRIQSGTRNNQAMIIRNPGQYDQIEPLFLANPTNELNRRGILGANLDGSRYYNVHAVAVTGADAEPILEEILDSGTGYVLGDFNRNINDGQGAAAGNIAARYNAPARNVLIPPDAATQNARNANPQNTLDYMFTTFNLANRFGTVLNQLNGAGTDAFPSDHFPVVYDDALGADPIEAIGSTIEQAGDQLDLSEFVGAFTNETVGFQIVTAGEPVTSLLTDRVDSDDSVEFTSEEIENADLDGDTRFPGGSPDVNISETGQVRIEYNSENLGFDADGAFNGYVITDLQNDSSVIPSFQNILGVNSSFGVDESNITIENSNTVNVDVEGRSVSPGDFLEFFISTSGL